MSYCPSVAYAFIVRKRVYLSTYVIASIKLPHSLMCFGGNPMLEVLDIFSGKVGGVPWTF